MQTFCFTIMDIIMGILNILKLVMDGFMALIGRLIPGLPSLSFNLPGLPGLPFNIPNFGWDLSRYLPDLFNIDFCLNCKMFFGDSDASPHKYLTQTTNSGCPGLPSFNMNWLKCPNV